MRSRAAVVHDKTAEGRPTPARRQRVIVERLQPEIDGGRFPIKRTPGESVVVTADVFADGHDLLAGVVKYRALDVGRTWTEDPLTAIDNDSWMASFVVDTVGRYEYTIEAWIDR